MHPERCLAVAILSVGLSLGLSVAAPAADPAVGLPDLPENRAEIEALRRGEAGFERPAGGLPAAVADTARLTRRAAFAAVVDGQDAKVRALAGRLAGATGDEALALQKEIEREKVATGRRLLEVQLEFAARDGDQERVRRLQEALAAWDAPAPAYAPVDRPAPAGHPVSANPGR